MIDGTLRASDSYEIGAGRKQVHDEPVSLKTLAPQSVLPVGEVKAGDAKPVERSFDLYRHGVEIRLEGSYGQLQAYLAQLEKLQQKLLWGKLEYRVIDYPKAELTLTVYTLSPDRTWLAL